MISEVDRDPVEARDLRHAATVRIEAYQRLTCRCDWTRPQTIVASDWQQQQNMGGPVAREAEGAGLHRGS